MQGFSRFSGGDYDEIAISGFAMTRGTLSVGRLDVRGIGRIRRRSEVGTGTILGVGVFGDDLAVDKLSVEGMCKVGGNVKARELSLKGVFQVSGDLACENLSASGSWKCRGNVDTRSAHLEGRIRVGGVLSADSVTVMPDTYGRVHDVIADRITICPSSLDRKSLWKRVSRILGLQSVIRARRIEGDDVQIDAVHVEHVHGKRIHIGPTCAAGTVEYSESIHVHPESRVKNALKLSE